MKFKYLSEFEKDFKKLSKKYKSLTNDFEDFKKVLEVDPKLSIFGDKGIKRIAGLGQNISYEILKVKRFRCKSISNKSKDSGLRVIYTYIEESDEIEFQIIEFIEIFHKNSKTNHDINRIKNYYSD